MGAEGKYDLMLAPSYDPEKVRKESTKSEPGSVGAKVKGGAPVAADGKSKVSHNLEWLPINVTFW